MSDTTDTIEAEEVEETEEPTTFSAKDIAAKLGLDPKAFRRWLRRQTDNRAGKGGRWSFSADEVDAYVAAYRKETTKAAEPEADDEEVEELNDELEELELDD